MNCRFFIFSDFDLLCVLSGQKLLISGGREKISSRTTPRARLMPSISDFYLLRVLRGLSLRPQRLKALDLVGRERISSHALLKILGKAQ
jgi:hypothetical protein